MLTLTDQEKKWDILFFLPMYFILGHIVFSFLFSLILLVFGISLDTVMIDPWFNVFFDGVMAFLGMIIFRHFINNDWQSIKGKRLQLIAWSLTIGFLILYATNIASGILVSFFSQESSANQSAIMHMLSIAPLQMMLSSIVLAPILEELVFRVGIFAYLYQRNRILAYVVSSLAFGMVHIIQGLLDGDLTQLLFLIPYSLLGSVFCYLYEKKETIMVPMLVHAANNFVSLALLMFF